MQHVKTLAAVAAALLSCLTSNAQMTLKRAESLVPRPNVIKGPVVSLIPKEKADIIDTLDTSDPKVKLILRGDNTWEYIKNNDVIADDIVFKEYWDTKKLSPYEVALADLPDRITIWLVDAVSEWCCPRQIKVYSKFGVRRGRRHQGVDLPLTVGTPVYAAFDGQVRISQYTSGYGNLVILRHANGLETYYGHLSKLEVEPGDWVRAGDIIGLGGSTGRSTGPHLHFETRYKGYAFDPQWIADFETGQLRHGVFVLKKNQLSISSKYTPESEEEEEEILLQEEADQAEAARIAAEEAAKRYYTIKSGDTLSKIAKKNGTTINELCRLNGYTTKTVLKVGRKIRVK